MSVAIAELLDRAQAISGGELADRTWSAVQTTRWVI